MKILSTTEFGNPVLRHTSRKLNQKEIESSKIQTLIADMRHTLISKKLGIGLAATQVGESIALAVIAIRPTPLRPKVKPFDLIIINPEIIENSKRRVSLWEGCISSGNGKAGLFAKVPRHTQITATFLDETGKEQTKTFRGLQAHVIQHEVDHLNGVLFVDRVKDTKTFMTYSEYKRMKRAMRDKIKA